MRSLRYVYPSSRPMKGCITQFVTPPFGLEQFGDECAHETFSRAFNDATNDAHGTAAWKYAIVEAEGVENTFEEATIAKAFHGVKSTETVITEENAKLEHELTQTLKMFDVRIVYAGSTSLVRIPARTTYSWTNRSSYDDPVKPDSLVRSFDETLSIIMDATGRGGWEIFKVIERQSLDEKSFVAEVFTNTLYLRKGA